MYKYIIKKTLHLVIVLFGVSIITFILTNYIQGNPAASVVSDMGLDLTKENVEDMEFVLGLKENKFRQYVKWLKGVLRGDLGKSYISKESVTKELGFRFLITVKVTVLAYLLSVCISIPLGILLALNKYKVLNKAINGIIFIFMSIPSFVLGLTLVYFISVKFKLLPFIGLASWKNYILPLMTLSLPMICRYTRLVKSNLNNVMGEDFVFLLRSKGYREKTILRKHVLKNAMLPIISVLGLGFGSMIGGSIIVENIFSIPGIGSFLLLSISNRDYPVILGYILIMSVVFVFVNYFIDIISVFIDLRIRLKGIKNE